MPNIISTSIERATHAMDRFLLVLSFVPPDKLLWSPAPTAKSALQIAAHCAGYSGGFASLIRAGKFPDSVEEFLGPVHARIDGINNVAQAEAVLRAGIADTIAALDGVKPEQIGAMIDTPIGRQPFTFFMALPAIHLYGHTAQIDYLQTCWGDQVVHF